MKKLLTLLLLIASASCSYALMAPGNNIISRKVAEESIVLLRNEESALPLTKSDTVAVFGPGQIGYIKGAGNHSDVMFDPANGVITHEKLVQNARTIFGTILRV